jgi:hypothetical protein
LRKFGSISDGLATKSTPFSTDDGEKSVLAAAETTGKRVKNPANRALAAVPLAPARPSGLTYLDVETGNKAMGLFRHLQ